MWLYVHKDFQGSLLSDLYIDFGPFLFLFFLKRLVWM